MLPPPPYGGGDIRAVPRWKFMLLVRKRIHTLADPQRGMFCSLPRLTGEGIYAPCLDGSSCFLSEKEFILSLTHSAECFAPSPVLRGRAGEGELPSPMLFLLTSSLLYQSLKHPSIPASQHPSIPALQHYSTTGTSIPYFLKPSSSSKSLLFVLSANSAMLRFLEKLWPEQA